MQVTSWKLEDWRTFLLLAFAAFAHPAQAQWQWEYYTPTGNHLFDVAYRSTHVAVAVGELGVIIRSSDDGITWNVIDDGFSTDLHAVTFVNDNVVIAAGDSGRVMISRDAGVTWSNVILDNRLLFTDVAGHGSSAWLVADSVLFVSHDEGRNWTRHAIDTAMRLIHLDAVTDSILWCVGDWTVQLSTDAGESWTPSAQLSADRRMMYTGVSHFDANTIWVVGNKHDFVWDTVAGFTCATTDSGRTWSRDTMYAINGVACTGASNAIILSVGTPLKTTDLGKHWAAQSVPSYNVLSIAACDSHRAIIVGIQGMILRTINEGSDWMAVGTSGETAMGWNIWMTNGLFTVFGIVPGWQPKTPSPVVAALGPRARALPSLPKDLTRVGGLYFLDTLHGWLWGIDTLGQYGINGSIWRTNDGGSAWAKVVDVSSGAPANDGYGNIWFTDSSHGYFVGNNIVVTHDGGRTWRIDTVQSVLGSLFLGICFANSTTGWACGSGIVGTTNAGETWTEQLSMPFVDSYYESIFALDTLHVWACGGGSIARTTNGGAEWNVVQVQAQNGLTSICFIDSLNGWCVAPYVVFHTTDGGITWREERLPVRTWGNIFFVDGREGWICGGDGILHTTNAGGLVTVHPPAESPHGAMLTTYPVPARTLTTIAFTTTTNSHVHSELFDVRGVPVKEVLDAVLPAGEHVSIVDLTSLPPGLYFCRTQSGSTTLNSRIIVAR